MAGLVWNPPTSCAWAARVYVSNKEARDHGLRHVGLPSRLAAFEMGEGQQAAAAVAGAAAPEVAVAAAGASWTSRRTWWNPQGEGAGETGDGYLGKSLCVKVYKTDGLGEMCG
jgi:hypothetical protein